MPRLVLVLHEHAMLYEVAIAAEVFGVDRSDLSPTGDWYEVVVACPERSPRHWLPQLPAIDVSEIGDADLIVVPSTDSPGDEIDPALATALREAHASGARIAALCTGSFVLAEAGLLDDRVATTHWMHADDLARRYPRVKVRADVLYVDEGDILTSAGKTAALDLCLHLVRRDLGAAVANDLGRRLVVPPHRHGGRAQFVSPPPSPGGSGLARTAEWARARLDQPLTVVDLARHAGLSSRQLARRMHAEFGAAPLTWLHQQRLARAQELLERTGSSIDQIAASCGMGSAATLRRRFRDALGVTPSEYRATFRLG
ncbi:GlxA family transcriptional regulator [Amycolatopsis dendrobii]|uniref:Helix-turn-helix domain-containing protein n=1 Tax=Amycolatopsis dendrobii TaxID=2760662 RepID=A0A7W3ZBX2_9PSEU|nr:helix-turn-helix domain-containing protein [Amycolatopsis dendrobii]MBB1155293.1 helix-turn-helix domain-containing protein [Amycolatopsis dendrobii]